MNPLLLPARGFAPALMALGGLLLCWSGPAAEGNPPVIVSQPGSLILKAGSRAVFGVRVESDLPLSYQWTLNGTNLVDDDRIEGSTSAALAIAAVQRNDQYLYAVTVTYLEGKAVSQPATLWVLEPPFFLTQPLNQNAVTGSVVTFQTRATGIEPLRYQWRRNGSDILGATLPALTLSNVAVAASGRYEAVVSDAVGTNTTRAARLLVFTPPAIIREPSNTNVLLGTPSVILDIAPIGTPPRAYQWRLNGAHIPGATNIAYTNAPVELADGGSYSLVVANEVDAVLSAPAFLLFDDIPREPLARDNLGDPTESLLAASGIVQGDNLLATREPDEPYHADKPGDNSVWFTWIAPDTGIATFSTAGSSFDTLLAVYEGFSYPSLLLIAADDDRGGFLTSRVQFNAVAGASYQIAIDGLAGESGPFVLSWSLEITPETVPIFFVSPANLTAQQGDDVTMSVLAGGVPPLSFQWLRDGVPLSGASGPSLLITNVQPENVGEYSVEVANAFGRIAESQPGSLQLGLATTAQARAKWECLLPLGGGGGGGGFQAAAAPSASPVVVRAGVPDLRMFDVGVSSGGSLLHCLGSPRAKAWMWMQAVDDGDFLINTTNSTVPTLLAVYPQSPFATLPATPLIACAATNAGDGRASVVTLPAVAGANYWVMVDRLNGAGGVVQLNWILGQRPRSANPTNIQFQMAPPGGTVVLNAGITNAPSPATGYQWYREGRPLLNQTNPVLNLPALANSDSGHYSVRATNALGVSDSAWCLRVGTEVALDVGMTNSAGSPLAHVSSGSPREFVLQAAPDLQPPVVWTNLAVKTGTDCFDYFWPVRHTNAPWQGFFRAFTTNATAP